MNMDNFKDLIDLSNPNRVSIDRFKAMIADNLNHNLDDNQVILFMLTYYAARAVGQMEHDEGMVAAFSLARQDSADVDDLGRESEIW